MKEGSGNSNMVRDNNSCKNLQNFLKNFSPFKETDSSDSIRNTVTRVNGSLKLNVNTARTVGSIRYVNKSCSQYHFKSL